TLGREAAAQRELAYWASDGRRLLSGGTGGRDLHDRRAVEAGVALRTGGACGTGRASCAQLALRTSRADSSGVTLRACGTGRACGTCGATSTLRTRLT